MKKLSTFSAFLFIPIIALLFVQCSESTMEANDQETVLSLDKGEPLANNLSFPGLLADNYTITPIATPLFTTAFIGPYTDLSAEELAIAMGDTWYAQKVTGNVWQAEFAYTDQIDVTTVDWGDNMESFSPTVGTPFRVEFSLFKDLDVPMMTYPMALLANPSSPDEIQGTNNKPIGTNLATIATDKARIAIQPYSVDATTLVWNGSSWTGAGTSESVVFGVELNVAGKLIYGAAQKGWRPAKEGKYRITFYLENSEVNLSNAVIGSAPTDQVAFPVIEAGITYVDIVVLPRSGGKK